MLHITTFLLNSKVLSHRFILKTHLSSKTCLRNTSQLSCCPIRVSINYYIITALITF